MFLCFGRRVLSSWINQPSHCLHLHNLPLELNHFQSSHSPWPQESFSDHSLFLYLYLEQSMCFLPIAQQHSIKYSFPSFVAIMPPVAIPCIPAPSSVFLVVLFPLSLPQTMSTNNRKTPPPGKQFVSQDNIIPQVNVPGNGEVGKDVFPTYT